MAKREDKKITVTITMDEELKNDFAEVCEELGFSLAGAMTVFAKQMVRDRKFPFVPDARNMLDDVDIELDETDHKLSAADVKRFIMYMDKLRS